MDSNGKGAMTQDDPLMVINDVLHTKKTQYEIVGNLVRFKPYVARILWDRINEELKYPPDVYWHSWDPDGDRKLPRRWRSPSRNKNHAHYEASLPPSPPLRARGNRLQPYDSVKALETHSPEKLEPDKEMHGVWPDVDLRFKNSPRDTHDASRLLFNTSVLMCSNELFSRGIERAFEADHYYREASAEHMARQMKNDAEASRVDDAKEVQRSNARILKPVAQSAVTDLTEQDKTWSDNAAMRQ